MDNSEGLKTKTGCSVGKECCSILVYADNILSLAPTVTAMKKLILVCSQFSEIYNLVFNPKKSELITYFKYENNLHMQFLVHRRNKSCI